MCGRYVSVAADSDLTLEFEVQADDVVDEPPPPSWNVAPTDPARIVVERRPHGAPDGSAAVHQLRSARWGLVPAWSKDARGGARMINARIETVTAKPAFARAAARRRCLVPATGYYEWQRTDAGKVPIFLHDPAGELLAFAGLYELWRDPSKDRDDWFWTYTIITQQASDLLGEIHDRTPVLVPVAAREQWLDCSSDDPTTARSLLDAFAPARLEPYEVGPAVGNVRNNGPELIEPAEPEPEQPTLDL